MERKIERYVIKPEPLPPDRAYEASKEELNVMLDAEFDKILRCVLAGNDDSHTLEMLRTLLLVKLDRQLDRVSERLYDIFEFMPEG